MGFLDKLAKYLGQVEKPVEISVPPKEAPKSEYKPRGDVFDKGLDFILAAEGGYVNDQYDPGGETKFGISKKAYPHLDIANITLEDARTIYYRDYWLQSGAKVSDISPELAMILFDTAVNMGTGTAVKFLQRTLRIKEDGIIGEETRAALERGNLEDIIQWYMVNRILRYSELTTWSRYRRGWLKRAMGLLRYVGRV